MKRGLNKRGQISVFIIIAVIIVAATGIGFFVYQNQVDNEYFSSSEIKPQYDKLINSIIACQETTASESLEIIGLQGGYYKQPEKNVELEGVFIPYYYFDGIIDYPNKTDVENNIASYVNDNLRECIMNINSDFNLKFNAIETEVIIRNKNLDFSSDVNIKISKDGKNTFFELKNHPVTISSELEAILELAYYFTDSHEENPELYCIDCVADMAEENDLYFDLIPINEIVSLIIISENHTSSEPYSFEFLNKYTGDETGVDIFDIAVEGDEEGEVPEAPEEE